VSDSPARGRAKLNREFERREDPWDDATGRSQQDRIGAELEMLDAVRGTRMTASLKLSVVIPTHNRRDVLLGRLCRQFSTRTFQQRHMK